MFRRTALIAMTLLVGATALLTYLLMDVGEADLAFYEEVKRKAQPEHFTAARNRPGEQQRTTVVKSLWICNGEERRHVRLTCDSSRLEFSVEGNRAELVEHMEGVRGVVQDRLFYVLPDGREVVTATPQPGWKPMQEVRYLEAERASFSYNESRFVTEEAKLTRVRAPGHEPIDSPDDLEPMLTGTAKSAELILGGQGLDFKAHHLKARIYPFRGTP